MTFISMSVVFESSTPLAYVATVPVEETRVQRFVRLFTRKDAPTAEVTMYAPHFHTVEVDDSHAETARDMFERLTDRYGYEIVSVVVDDDGMSTELVTASNGSPSGAHVGQLLVAFEEDPYYSQGLVAAVHEYGFGFADDLSEWMQDNYRGEFDSPAAYAEHMYDELYAPNMTEGMPNWVCVDWDASAKELGYDDDYVTHPETYATHVFYRHG